MPSAPGRLSGAAARGRTSGPVLLMEGCAPPSFWCAIGRQTAECDAITVEAASLGNLLPVTAVNIVGAAVLVAGVRRFMYRRKRPRDPAILTERSPQGERRGSGTRGETIWPVWTRQGARSSATG
jgi:hypothetical protein